MPLWELGKQAGLSKQTMWLPGNLGFVFLLSLSISADLGIGRVCSGQRWPVFKQVTQLPGLKWLVEALLVLPFLGPPCRAYLGMCWRLVTARLWFK